jgi:hypothetical protein
MNLTPVLSPADFSAALKKSSAPAENLPRNPPPTSVDGSVGRKVDEGPPVELKVADCIVGSEGDESRDISDSDPRVRV